MTSDAKEDLAARRARLRAAWERAGGEGEGGLERYAAWAQRVWDEARRAEPVTGGGGAAAPHARAGAVRAFLDDLVDLSVTSEFAAAKALVMASEAAYDGPPVHEEESGLDGFHPAYRPGEGRYRHLAMTAASAWRYPEALVDVAARSLGGDIDPPPGSDGAADLATNEVGKALADMLGRAPLAVLDDGGVERWLLAAFSLPPGRLEEAQAAVRGGA